MGYLPGLSDSEVSIGFDGGEGTNAPAVQDDPISYDGQELPNSDDEIPSIPTKKPPSVNAVGPTTVPNASPTSTPPLRAPSASSGGWQQGDEADASSAQEITQCRRFLGVITYISIVVLPFWL